MNMAESPPASNIRKYRQCRPSFVRAAPVRAIRYIISGIFLALLRPACTYL